jgi:HprK-related kinase A
VRYESTFGILRFRFRFGTDSAAAAGAVERVLGPLRDTSSSGPEHVYEVVDHSRAEEAPASFGLLLDSKAIIRNATFSDVLGYFLWHVMREAVAFAPGVIVHAGVVARGGRAVVLPGRSGSGKSTLVAGLLRAGFSFLSDELAAFDPVSGNVLPVPRALSLKRGSWSLLPELERESIASGGKLGDVLMIPPSAIGSQRTGRSSVVRFVVAPTYVEGSALQLVPVTRAEGLLDLAQNAFNLDRLGSEGFAQLGRVAAGASCYRLIAGSLDEAVTSVVQLFDAASARDDALAGVAPA